MLNESDFTKVKHDRINLINRENPKGLDCEWSVFLQFFGTRKFRTVLDRDGKCIDLVEHNDPNIKNIRHMRKNT